MTTDVTSADPDAARAARVLPVATAAQTRAAIRTVTREHRGLVAAAGTALLAATFAALAVPWLLGTLVDIVVDGRAGSDLDRTIIALAAATIGQGVLAGIGLALAGTLSEKFLATLREQAVERALALPLAEVERGGTGDLVGRVVGDVDAVSEAIRVALPEMLVSTLVVLLTVVGLGALDWRLALAGLLAVPIQVVVTRRYLRRSAPIFAAERAAEGRRAHHLHTSVAGARTVRVLGLGPAHLRRLDEASQRTVDLAVATARERAWFASGLNAAEFVGLAAILVTGFLLVRDSTITIGMATAAALYFHRLFDPIGIVLSQLDHAQAAWAALARLVGVTSLAPPARPSELAATVDASVELKGVHFAYDGGPPVLDDVDLRIEPGERVALVGASGAGKTTIAKLVAGIHRPVGGSVRVGAASADELGDEQLGRLVTLVSQEVHVFAGRLADDLRLARPDAADDDVRAALSLVGAWPWVEALEDGLDTVVGDGGHQLGPTEAQQLALARLVLVDPAVAVLDEATAEAGSAGARVLEASADAAIAGRTALVVAHRLTQAVAADRIVVLDAGRVVEQGSHDELLAGGGAYASLWAAWSLAR
ncbi:MAG: ABC transporter ATP-binding protein [Acidimicrobiales bacterium]|nr:ABC transporter ATP-binding protein [Acidimicrobiales bacterium]